MSRTSSGSSAATRFPTDVWYKAYPGLTARDLARNARIRNGFEKPSMSDDEIRRWVAEI